MVAIRSGIIFNFKIILNEKEPPGNHCLRLPFF
jgi:hypothetical protein